MIMKWDNNMDDYDIDFEKALYDWYCEDDFDWDEEDPPIDILEGEEDYE